MGSINCQMCKKEIKDRETLIQLKLGYRDKGQDTWEYIARFDSMKCMEKHLGIGGRGMRKLLDRITAIVAVGGLIAIILWILEVF